MLLLNLQKKIIFFISFLNFFAVPSVDFANPSQSKGYPYKYT